MYRILIPILLSLFVASSALAVPLKLSQQGKLLSSDKSPLDGEHQMTFRLFDSVDGNTAAWSETLSVDLEGGYYSVLLGETTALDDLLFSAGSLWLELSIDGVALEPRQEVVSVPHALRAGSAETVEGGSVDATEVSIDGELVIDAAGTWVGVSPEVLWTELVGVPADLLDGDDNDDTLATTVCSDGQVLAYSTTFSAWGCATSQTLTEQDVEDFVTNGALDLAAGSTVGGAAISTGAHTVDTDTQLSEQQVEGFISNGALDLAAGSTLAGAAISTGSHTVDTDTQLSEQQVEGFISNGALDLAAGSTVGGATISTGSHTVDTDTQLNEQQVEGFITNDALDLDAGTTIGGVTVTPPTVSSAEDTALAQNASLDVTHPADAGNLRSVTVLVNGATTIGSVFYTDLENGGADVVSGNTPTFSGNAAIQSDARFGSAALRAPTDVHYATWSVAPGTLNFGGGDFTIRLWFKSTQSHQGGGYWGAFMGTVAGTSNTSGSNWVIGMREFDGLRLSRNNSNSYDNASCWGPAQPNQWHHLALERSSGTIRLYVDGVAECSHTDVGSWGSNSLTQLHVGGLLDFDNTPGLYFDEIEISKSALYEGNNFTPPTAPASSLIPPGWHVVSNGSRFHVQYVDATTTRVTKLDAGSSHVQVVVRTYGD